MSLLALLTPALQTLEQRMGSKLDDDLTEQRIMRHAQGDTAHFAPLYERYLPRIYAYCLRRTENHHEAEDLCSQVFIRALQGIDTYRGGMVAAWLFRIAHNVTVNHFRGKRKVIPLESIDIAEDVGISRDLDDAEDRRILAELMRELSEDKRNLLALMLDGGLTSDEVGEVLGKSAGAVRVEFHRLVKQLRKRYLQVTGA